MVQHRKNPRGIAYVLVLSVVGIAALIGYAMLSGASIQAEAGWNYTHSASADYLTESAVQTAAYYLQRDLAGMPAAWVQSGYKLKASNLTLSGVDGSFDVDATSNAQTDGYDIHVTARSGGSTPITRTSTATVRVVRVSPTYAVGVPGAISINTRNYINSGPVVASGAISTVGAPVLNGGSRTFSSSEFTVPDFSTSQVKYYGGNIAGGTYTMPNGLIGYPQTLSSGSISSPATLAVASNNPGMVFYCASDVTLAGAGTYQATIITRGKFELKFPSSAGGTVVMNHVSGFPAIMADGSLSIRSQNVNMSINGLVYAGRGTAFATLTGASGTTVKINGGLLMPAGQSMGNGNSGTMIVNYTASNINIDNMTTLAEPPKAIQFSNWQQ